MTEHYKHYRAKNGRRRANNSDKGPQRKSAVPEKTRVHYRMSHYVPQNHHKVYLSAEELANAPLNEQVRYTENFIDSLRKDLRLIDGKVVEPQIIRKLTSIETVLDYLPEGTQEPVEEYVKVLLEIKDKLNINSNLGTIYDKPFKGKYKTILGLEAKKPVKTSNYHYSPSKPFWAL